MSYTGKWTIADEIQVLIHAQARENVGRDNNSHHDVEARLLRKRFAEWLWYKFLEEDTNADSGS